MDAEKLLQELADGDLGDHIREQHVNAMLTDLADSRYDDDREWADGVAEWLKENYL